MPFIKKPIRNCSVDFYVDFIDRFLETFNSGYVERRNEGLIICILALFINEILYING